MFRSAFDRLTLGLSVLALAAAAAIVLVGGYRGTIAGLSISARDSFRALLVFSLFFLLRSWWKGEGFAPERRALGFLSDGWIGASGALTAGGFTLRGAVFCFPAAAAIWAALGAAIGLSEVAGLLTGHAYLFPDVSSAIRTALLAASLYGGFFLLVSVPAVLLAALWTLGTHPERAHSARGAAGVVRRATALLPLVATLLLAGRRPLWSLPSTGVARWTAGPAILLVLAAGVLLLCRVLPSAVRLGIRRPLTGLVALVLSAVFLWSLLLTPGRSVPRPAQRSRAGSIVRAGIGSGDPADLKRRVGPNVLLITIDTLRADHLGCYGNTTVRTPVMDALAASGTRFTNAVCEIPETGPSHASILTGLYPQTHGSRANGQRLADLPTIAAILAREGYRTAAFLSGYTLKATLTGLDTGFQDWDDHFSSFEALPGMILTARLREWGVISYVSLWEVWAERRADATNVQVVRWLRETASEESPFFLWVHYFDPHGPYDPPAPYDRMYYQGDERDPANESMKDVTILHAYQEKPGVTDVGFYVAQYEGEVTWTDTQLGVLLDELRALGLDERTVIILTSDHGESLTEHGYYFAHGGDLFEPSIRVPLIVAGPGLPSGRVVEQQVQSIDIAPTIASLLRVGGMEGVDGRPLPGIEGIPGRSGPGSADTGESPGELPADPSVEPETGVEPRPAGGSDAALDGTRPAFIEGEVTRERRGRTYEDPVAAKERAIRWGGFKLVSTPGFGRALYDLGRDPGESVDLTVFLPDLAERMSGRLQEWMDTAPATGEPVEIPEEERRRLESLGYAGR